MLGSFLNRGLVLIFGYAYPAYECYKSVERNKPEIEHLLFWCQYWILVAALTVFERIGDAFVSWLPLYSEAKVALFIYMWYPKTKGAVYVYNSFFRPYIAKYENDIDRNLLELRTRAGDYAVLYWHRAASYAQTRVFDILQFIASQSTPKPRPVQTQQQQDPKTKIAPAPLTRQPLKKVQLQVENKDPPSGASSASSSQDPREVAEPADPSSNVAPAAAAPVSAPPSPSAAPKPTALTKSPAISKPAEATQIESSATENGEATSNDTVMEDTVRLTRARLRRARSVPVPKETDSTGS